MYKLFDGSPSGIVQLVVSVAASSYYFFVYDGNFRRSRPTFFEEFKGGEPSDFAVLLGLGLLLWIGYSIAVVIADYRSNGRFW